jgi:hypothetical protein
MTRPYVGDTDVVSSKTSDRDTGGEGKVGYKVLAAFAGIIGAFAARKMLRLSWKTATGKEPPANPEHPEVTFVEAVSWAAVSGAVIGVIRMLAQRKVASAWHKSTGSLPPGLEETAA